MVVDLLCVCFLFFCWLLVCGVSCDAARVGGPAANVAASDTCPNVFFITFHNENEYVRLALSRDGQHFRALLNNSAIPDFDPIKGTTVRDPYVSPVVSPVDGLYHMVTTNIRDPYTINHWSSPDLITWSNQTVIDILSAYYPNDSVALWAPEYIWDDEKQSFLLFWAQQWARGHGHFNSECDNNNPDRVSFWSSYTRDFVKYSAPTPMYDPHCFTSSYAPFTFGLGGIDAHIQHYEDLYIMYYKDTRAPKQVSYQEMQWTSGIRAAYSTDLHTWSNSIPDSSIGTQLIGGFNGTEGPEILLMNSTHLYLYYDCSWQVTPPGWSRPPYGMAIGAYPDAFLNWSDFSAVIGSCTGNSTSLPDGVSFPDDSTHGSFLCIDNETYDRMVNKWGW